MKGPPPVFPLRPTPAPGPFRQTPPMIFLAVIGLFALGLAWRKAALVFALPPGPAEAYLGATSLLWAMAVGAYLGKILRRPGVIRDELATMPGRVGLSSAVLSVYFMAVVLLRYAPELAWTVLLTGFALHVALALLLIDVMRRGPPEGRGVTPAWQLSFTGFVVGGLGASGLQLPTLAVGLVYAAMPVAATIWTISLVQLVRRIPPAPLRPLLALHLGPASLLTTVSVAQHHPLLAIGFATLGAAILLGLLVSVGWVTVSGFSPFWGAFGFPLAAYANALLTLGGPWRMAGVAVLAAATVVVLGVSVRILQGWVKGDLARRTNAATA
jgi:tellurite resistance protein